MSAAPATMSPESRAHNIGQFVSRIGALLRALAWMQASGLDPTTAQVLDVGAAQGYGLRPFLVARFSMAQLHGLDLFADRVEEGLRRTPGLDLRVGDATAMPYADRSFDLVCEQFCFCHIPDDAAKASIAREMMRVSRGFILIHDWRMGSASRQLYGVSRARIVSGFRAGRSGPASVRNSGRRSAARFRGSRRCFTTSQGSRDRWSDPGSRS